MPTDSGVGQQNNGEHTGDMARDAARYRGKVGVGAESESPVNLSRWVRGEAMGRATAVGRSTYGIDLRPEAEARQMPSTDMRQPGGRSTPTTKPTGPKPKKK